MPIELMDARGLSDETLEAFRLRAVRARELGFAVADIAEILGVARETVSRWCSAFEEGGREALPQARSGRPEGSGRSLTEEQAEHLQRLIDANCPDALAIAATLWTRRAVRELIHREVGIRMPLRTVGEYLRRWGYTPQRPARKAYKQNPEEVKQWLENTYPAIETRAAAEGAEIHWGDEAGIRSTCHVGRGYARPGQTPLLQVPGSRFSVNMISTVSNQGTLRFMIYEGRMASALFIVFLTRLIGGATKKIFLIVDHLSVHESAAVDEWVAQRTEQIELFYLPKYAPERNPDEYLNCDVKAGVNAHGLPHSREELKSNLTSYLHKLAKLPERIISYFKHRHIQYAATPNA